MNERLDAIVKEFDGKIEAAVRHGQAEIEVEALDAAQDLFGVVDVESEVVVDDVEFPNPVLVVQHADLPEDMILAVVS